MINCFYVGIGGFLGSCLRYLFSQIYTTVNFPFSTLLINFLGAFIIGIISSTIPTNSKLSMFFKIGFCGGFTTFSTFSLETFNFLESGKIFLSLLYSLASILLCLFGVLLGKLIAKLFLSV